MYLRDSFGRMGSSAGYLAQNIPTQQTRNIRSIAKKDVRMMETRTGAMLTTRHDLWLPDCCCCCCLGCLGLLLLAGWYFRTIARGTPPHARQSFFLIEFSLGFFLAVFPFQSLTQTHMHSIISYHIIPYHIIPHHISVLPPSFISNYPPHAKRAD